MTENRLRGTLISKHAPSPLWVRTQQASEHYNRICVSYGNQEATMAQLVEAAEKLRDLQIQWKNA